MREMKKHRLSMDGPALIVRCMEKALYEIEQNARRMRSEEMARLLRKGTDALIALFSRAWHAKAVRHA